MLNADLPWALKKWLNELGLINLFVYRNSSLSLCSGYRCLDTEQK
jgi:hypothetical protein